MCLFASPRKNRFFLPLNSLMSGYKGGPRAAQDDQEKLASLEKRVDPKNKEQARGVRRATAGAQL